MKRAGLAVVALTAVLGLAAARAQDPPPEGRKGPRPGEWILEKHSTPNVADYYVYTWVDRVDEGTLTVLWQTVESDRKTAFAEPKKRTVDLAQVQPRGVEDPVEETLVAGRKLRCRRRTYPEAAGTAWLSSEVPVYGVAKSTVAEGGHVSEVVAWGWSGGAPRPVQAAPEVTIPTPGQGR